ncbi:hypothetical protein EYB26_002478 [Talaromyces marneffei]|uniref:uncharacterized protein n=1 Tax=Talaromyces marneffei TaxID=37727 RepID=UPI0012A82E22|nr:uncharacterized protein EYB26_002478 [Talaromyces marneffei]QGA14822.1 hypothetical protein EYB26_002478 [Talaromyces marneffei]
MHTKTPSTFFFALFAFLLVSVSALPRVLRSNTTPTQTLPLPSESFSMQSTSQIVSSTAGPTPETHPTLRLLPNPPLADIGAGSKANKADKADKADPTSTSSATPSATVTTLEMTPSFLTSLRIFVANFSRLMGVA